MHALRDCREEQMNTLREDFHPRPGWTFGRGGNVGTGTGGMSECEPVPHTASGTGGGRSEAIRDIYYSDRQLPPGHDPGADSGEAPTAGSVAHGH